MTCVFFLHRISCAAPPLCAKIIRFRDHTGQIGFAVFSAFTYICIHHRTCVTARLTDAHSVIYLFFVRSQYNILYYNVHNMFCPLTRSRFCHTRDCCARAAAAAATATAPGVESIGRETCERCANNTSKPVRGMWTI